MSPAPSPLSRPSPRGRGLTLAGLLLATALTAAGLHLALGAVTISPADVWQALTEPVPGNPAHDIVLYHRLPRLLAALVVGAALALAGGLMQAATGNPLADPGILGINSGAALFVVAGLLATPSGASAPVPWLAAAGALAAAVAVLALGGRGQDPVRLTLAGAMVAALCSAMTALLLLLDQQGLESLRRWLTGALGSTAGTGLALPWPALATGVLLAAVTARALNLYRLGPSVAVTMGVNVGRLRVASLAAVVLLAGSAVAMAGPIGFVGLVAPHAARLLVGEDHRRVTLVAPLLGALLLVLADTLARTLIRPLELNTGIVTALVGAPLFILLVLRRVR
ncbi:iron ABC transporter permease [Achromobacter sp. GG226]|uniref:FecCD family ABC transporter permease n=1 Tax=Verticiella alkaliphila TaxID=2779529 RepID=UPI001C0BB18F|nr:iron ABC transporter permease [Verticiella sp. GG226]MBU4610545.1 iron ABC transporter permease [Verticiella sp. GG226]